MADSRLAKICLGALCALGPAVFLVKAVARPEGDRVTKPSAVPAVPVVVLTIGGVSPSDVEGPRTALPMPGLSAFLRDATIFSAPQLGAPPGAPAVATALLGAFPKNHGVDSESARAKEGFPSLAAEARKLGFQTALFSDSKIATDHGLAEGFGLVRELPGATAQDFAAELARFLRDPPPPRFLVWIDVARARGAAKSKRTLAEADAILGAVDAELHRLRVAGDAITLLACDPNEIPSLPARALVAIRFPAERRAGTQCPTALSTADLAPTALAVLRSPAPAAWKGVNREPDVRKFVSSGPAVAGPFPRAGGPAIWCAEEGSLALVATGDGAVLQFHDASDPNNRNPPQRLVEAIQGASGGAP